MDLSDSYVTIEGNIGTGRTQALVALFEREKTHGYSPKIVVPSGTENPQYHVATNFTGVEEEEVITEEEVVTDLEQMDAVNPVFIIDIDQVADEVIEEIDNRRITAVTKVNKPELIESGEIVP